MVLPPTAPPAALQATDMSYPVTDMTPVTPHPSEVPVESTPDETPVVDRRL